MADYEIISWISPVGVETIFSGQDWVNVSGWSGFDMADIEHFEDTVPFEDGSHYRGSKTLPRDLDLNIKVWGTSRSELFQRIRALTQSLNVYKGMGKIRFISPDGIDRSISCLYKDGLQGEEGKDGVYWRKIILTFRAFDPFFYGSETTEVFKLDENPPLWFPIFPLNLGGDAVSSQINIDNDGDVRTYPTWTITGPGENPKMTNLTTGEYVSLNDIALSESDSITIDTKRRLITLSDGTNLLPILSWGSTFWALEPRQNSIKIEMANATSDSSIQLAYSPRYLGV